MGSSDGGSILFVHHRDVSTPIGTTVPYYVSNELADEHTVHVVCRKRQAERSTESDQDAELHAIHTGDVPVLSTIAFHLLATLYVSYLAIVRRFDIVYGFQSCLIQGWIGSRLGNAEFAIGLQSVPVRQSRDFTDFTDSDIGLSMRLSIALLLLYAKVVGVLLRRSSTVICLTDGILEVTEEVYGVDLSAAHVLDMGVDVEKFSRPDAAEGSGSSTSDLTLAYVGNVSRSRDLDHVIEAIAQTDHDVTFRIAGQGPEEYVCSLLHTAESLSVSDQVEWLGLLPHEEVPELLANADATISPLPDIESYRISFPAKLLEYMAAGTQVIATDIRSHRKLIEDGTNGFLYDGTADDLVNAIDSCIEDGANRDERVRRARETAKAYDWSVIVDEYERVLFGGAEPHRPRAAVRERTAASD